MIMMQKAEQVAGKKVALKSSQQAKPQNN